MPAVTHEARGLLRPRAMKTASVALALCALLTGCQHRAAAVEQKPSAPVKLTLETRALGHGEYELTLFATTTAPLDAMELKLGDTSEKFSGLESGATCTITAHVRLNDGEGREVFGAARVVRGQRQMTAATGTWLGVTPPEKPTTVIPLPDGDQAEEVRE